MRPFNVMHVDSRMCIKNIYKYIYHENYIWTDYFAKIHNASKCDSSVDCVALEACL